MSKGCTVALIVAGIIIVLLIIAIAVGYFFWGDLVKAGTASVMNEAKNLVARDLPEGVDTTQFNALSDAFVERFTNDKDISAETYGPMFQSIQGVMSDDKITAEEVDVMQQAMVSLYPDLGALLETPDTSESWMPDSTAVMEDSL